MTSIQHDSSRRYGACHVLACVGLAHLHQAEGNLCVDDRVTNKQLEEAIQNVNGNRGLAQGAANKTKYQI